MSRSVNDLLHGSLDLLVLKALSQGPMHGYAITQFIEHRAEGDLLVVDAALYKSLHRLEDSGAVASEWGRSDNNRKAKYYSLTARGRALLRAEAETWRRYVSAIARVLETPA